MSLNEASDQPKPLSKLQKRLLFIIQRQPGTLSNFDLRNLNVRLGGEKELEASLTGLEDAGLIKRTDKRKWLPTERGASLIIPEDQLKH